jgi:DNA-binding response OmpR family regulator
MAVPDKQPEVADIVKGGNETILVAEDDASIRTMLKTFLESFGYCVITAEDGVDALAKFIENSDKIQLAIIDMIMPKSSGKEVSKSIRKVSPRIKILFSSGYMVDMITPSELKESGFDFIQKPVMPKELLKKVREILDR